MPGLTNPGRQTLRRAALILLVPLGACATRGDLQDLQSEVRALSARQDSATAALHRAITEAERSTTDSLDALSDQVFDARGNASERMVEIERELDGLQELVGVFQRTVDQLRDDMDVQQREFEQTIARMAAQRDSAAGGGEAEGENPVEPPGTAAQEQALFDVAVDNAQRGLNTSALRGFNTLLEEYPRSNLAPAAYLRRAELLTLEDRLEDAIADYLAVPRLFPTSDRIPEALYLAGLRCIELEDYSRAREYLERVINTYPDDPYAGQARERLAEIP